MFSLICHEMTPFSDNKNIREWITRLEKRDQTDEGVKLALQQCRFYLEHRLKLDKELDEK